MSKSNIVKWFDPANAERYPLRMVAIDWTKDRDAIILRAAKADDDASMVFDPTSELGNLWLTLQGSKHNVSATNLFLTGDKLDAETGKAEVIQAEIRKVNSNYGYAYTPAQLAAMGTPKNLFLGANLNLHGAPWFSVGLLPYVAKARYQRKATSALPKPGIVRLTAAPAANAAPKVTRR